MPGSAVPRPTIAGDVLRIHRLLTRALEVSAVKSALVAREGYPDATHRQGLIGYVTALTTLLHAHHMTEDDSVFPYLRNLLPGAPYEALTAQHHAMDPILDQIREALQRIKRSEQAGPALQDLASALQQMNALWHTHISLEEAQLSEERIGAVVDDAEQARMSQVFAREGRRHQMGVAPLYWLIPFLLYNLEGYDRQWMEAQMPSPRLSWVVTRVLLPRIWKKRWAPMAPFLLEP